MMRTIFTVLQFVVVLGSVSFVESKIQCIGANNKPVDWFMIYKLPRVDYGKRKVFKDGLGMAYRDNTSAKWKFLEQSIQDADNQPVAYTLNQLYGRVKRGETDSLAYLLYNDDTPDDQKVSTSRAHAKGGFCFDKQSGFLLAHTTPRFPPPSKEGYKYPQSGSVFGQVMLCTSLASDQLDSIAEQMKFMNPNVYDSYITDDFKTISNATWSFIRDEEKNIVRKKNKVYANRVTLKTMGGKGVVSFSKSRHFGKDLYEDFISPTLKCGLLVQSWMNGNGDLHTVCKPKLSVKNIKTFDFNGLTFKSSQDHSKWAISDFESKRVTRAVQIPTMSNICSDVNGTDEGVGIEMKKFDVNDNNMFNGSDSKNTSSLNATDDFVVADKNTVLTINIDSLENFTALNVASKYSNSEDTSLRRVKRSKLSVSEGEEGKKDKDEDADNTKKL